VLVLVVLVVDVVEAKRDLISCSSHNTFQNLILLDVVVLVVEVDAI
jgi:hypothetical protein